MTYRGPRVWSEEYNDWTLPPIAGGEHIDVPEEGDTWEEENGAHGPPRYQILTDAETGQQYPVIGINPDGSPVLGGALQGPDWITPPTVTPPTGAYGGVPIGQELVPGERDPNYIFGDLPAPIPPPGYDRVPNPDTGTWFFISPDGSQIDSGVRYEEGGPGVPRVPITIQTDSGPVQLLVSQDAALAYLRDMEQFNRPSADTAWRIANDLVINGRWTQRAATELANELELRGTLSADTAASIFEQGRQFDVSAGFRQQEIGLQQQQLQQQEAQFGQRLQFDRDSFSQQLGFNYDSLAASVGGDNADRLLNLAIAQGDVATQNALRAFGAAETSKDRTIALASLQAQDQRSREQQEQTLLATIGSLAQEPGSLTRLAAVLEAGGPSPISTAIGMGEDIRTPESVFPLAGSLGLLDRLRQPSGFLQDIQAVARTPSPAFPVALPSVPTQVPIPQRPRPFLQEITTEEAPVGPLFAREVAEGAPMLEGGQVWVSSGGPEMTAYVYSLEAQQPDVFKRITSGESIVVQNPDDTFGHRYRPAQAPELAIQPPQTFTGGTDTSLPPPPTFAKGGVLDSGDVAIVGEEGPELLVGNRDGSTTVIPMDKIRGFQEGGIFSPDNPFLQLGRIGSVPTQDIDRAMSFLDRITQSTLRRTPFRTLPTPVGVSAPGTSPFLQQMAAALTATGAGFPQEQFLREAALLRPRGLPFNPIRRTF